jgi:hypothetical protein
MALPFALAAMPAHATDVWLRAIPFEQTFFDYDGIQIPVTMWGYALCQTNFTSCGTPTSPGPVIRLAANDTTPLVMHLQNRLPTVAQLDAVTNATSLLIPGLPKALTPVKFTDDQGRQRIRSFDVETPRSPTAASIGVYTWNDVPPGTYMYQSGTHPQVQVQMGLYGAIVKSFQGGATGGATGVAYDPMQAAADPSFDEDHVLVFSEIDPVLHKSIESNRYANPDCDPQYGPCLTSTEGYAPYVFLINGKPYTPGSPPAINTSSDRVLLRLVNAGIENHAPQLLGGYFDVLAEDASPALVKHVQYNTLLPAAKTQDLLLTSQGTYSLFDRRLRLVTGQATGGGMFAKINMGPPVAVDDEFYVTAANGSLTTGGYQTGTNPPNGVLANDVDPHGVPLRVTVGSVQNIVIPAGATLSVNTTTATARGSVTFNLGTTSTWVGDATFTYTASENASGVPLAQQLVSAPATAHLVRDQIVTSAIFRNPTGTANDRWDLAGTVRAVPAGTRTMRITFGPGTASNCPQSGNLVGVGAGAVAVGSSGAWTYTALTALPPSTCNQINVEAQVNGGGMPNVVNGGTHSSVLLRSFTRPTS